MTDLAFSGPLDLGGLLQLAAAPGGHVTIGSNEMMVTGNGTTSQGTGIAVVQPPNDEGTSVQVVTSFNAGVTIGGVPVVALGVTMQGNLLTWPGMVLPSTNNTGAAGVTIDSVPINVVDDAGVTLPNSGPFKFSGSGQ